MVNERYSAGFSPLKSLILVLSEAEFVEPPEPRKGFPIPRKS
jgi:hypothetical protein